MAFTTVRDRQHGALLGYLVNLTSQGLLLIGEKPLEVDTHLTLDIELPDELPAPPNHRLAIQARVVCCLPDSENPREFNIGFEFLNLTAEHTQVIQSLLERYAFRYRP